MSATDAGKRSWVVVLAQQHLGLLVSGFVLLIVGTRIVVVARGDFSTALGILDAADPATVILGSLVRLAYLWPLFVMAVLALRGWHLTGVAIALLFFVSALLAPSWLLFGFFVAVGLAALVWTPLRRHREHERLDATNSDARLTPEEGTAPTARDERVAPWQRLTRNIAIPFVVVYSLLGVFSGSMWQPAQAVRVNDRWVVGYPLNDATTGTFTVLTQEDRKLVLVDATRVTKRFYCTPADQRGRTKMIVFRLLESDPQYVTCPSDPSPAKSSRVPSRSRADA